MEMNAVEPARVYVVRHGETDWSRDGRHTGVSERVLTPEGERQSRAIGALLRGIVFAGVFASPRVRARRTAELAGFGDRLAVDPDLAEWDYGDYEGLTRAEIWSRRPGWNPFWDGCPGGESPAAVAARADAAIARWRRAGGSIVVFSHGHFLRALAARWVDWPVAEGRRLALDPATVGVLGYEHGSAAEPAIVRWNMPAGHVA